MSTCAEHLRNVKVSLVLNNVTLEEIAAIAEFLRKYRGGVDAKEKKSRDYYWCSKINKGSRAHKTTT